MVRVRVANAVLAGELLSLTWMVKVYVPAVVGLPVMAPEDDSRRFGGRGFEPDNIEKVYGPVPLRRSSWVE